MKSLTVKAGNHTRTFCPVRVALPKEIEASALREKKTGREVPCQVWRKGDELQLSWILGYLRTGEERTYELVSGKGPCAEGVSLKDTPGDQVDVKIAGIPFTAYRYGAPLARPHLYPVIGPYRCPITRRLAEPEDKDMDHHHHRSIWVSHGEVNEVDNWSEMPGHGRTVHRSFEALESGPVMGRIRAGADWVSQDGKKVLEEVKELRFYAQPASCRAIDLDVVLTATEGEVVFGDTKEGGIASVRVQPSMEVRNGGRIENSYGGIDEGETWGKQAAWCDYSGDVQGRHMGIAIFDHPDSFRYPTYWHVRSYGLMTANPFGLSFFKNDPNIRGDYTLGSGEALSFRYRLYIHPGDATDGKVGEKYHDFVNPPEVEIG